MKDMTYPDPTTGRRIGHIGNFGIGYTLADHKGRNTYKLEIPLRLYDEPLRLMQLPHMDVEEQELTLYQAQNLVVQLYRGAFGGKIHWMGRYANDYVVSLPDSATDEQINQFVSALERVFEQRRPRPAQTPPSIRWWQFWKRFGFNAL